MLCLKKPQILTWIFGVAVEPCALCTSLKLPHAFICVRAILLSGYDNNDIENENDNDAFRL